ncbi:MAG TPA: hypothetical protein VF695_07260 [Sphingomonas sp.]|jgi:hypothetical protein
MNGVGKSGPGSFERASFLDRLVARADLSTEGTPVWPMLAAAPITFLLPPTVALVGEKWFAGLALLVTLVPFVWLGLWCARAMYGWSHPYASPRWIHAVHAVVGDRNMSELLADLGRCHGGEPDHVLTRREVIEAVAGQRRRARDAKVRARGVRLSGPDPVT